MNELLAKFAAVEIQSRGRVSPEDIAFCDHQQAAYESALSGYKELSALWSKMAAVQKEHTGSDTPEDNNDYSDYDSTIVRNYLSSEKGAWLSVEAIQNHLNALHRLFLEVLVHYFNETYHLSLTKTEARRAFLPKNPGYGAEKEEAEEQDSGSVDRAGGEINRGQNRGAAGGDQDDLLDDLQDLNVLPGFIEPQSGKQDQIQQGDQKRTANIKHQGHVLDAVEDPETKEIGKKHGQHDQHSIRHDVA